MIREQEEQTWVQKGKDPSTTTSLQCLPTVSLYNYCHVVEHLERRSYIVSCACKALGEGVKEARLWESIKDERMHKCCFWNFEQVPRYYHDETTRHSWRWIVSALRDARLQAETTVPSSATSKIHILRTQCSDHLVFGKESLTLMISLTRDGSCQHSWWRQPWSTTTTSHYDVILMPCWIPVTFPEKEL